MNLLTIDTKDNCYVINEAQMNDLQQRVASSITLEREIMTSGLKAVGIVMPQLKLQGNRLSYFGYMGLMEVHLSIKIQV